MTLNKVLAALTALLLIAGGAFWLYCSREDFKEQQQMSEQIEQYNKEQEDYELAAADEAQRKQAIKDELHGVACWGGTLTSGAGDQYTYTYFLDQYFRENDYDLPITNLGVFGENNLTTLGRCGAIPFTVGAFTIPAAGNLTEITVGSAGGGEVIPLTAQSNPGLNPISIAGVEGTLYGDPDSADSSKISQYYFSRLKSGESLDVADGTTIVTNGQLTYKDYISILNLNREEDSDSIAALYDAYIQNYASGSGRYIILGQIDGDNESNQGLDNSLVVRYGEHYFNIRKYICSADGVEASGLTLTDEDKKKAANGEIPAAMLGSTEGTLNRYGCKALACGLFEKLEEMSYIKK